MLIVLQVREEMCEAIFLNDVKGACPAYLLRTRSKTAIRRFYKYFAEYFDKKEWRILSLRLFQARSFITEKFKILFTQFIKSF